MILSLLHWLRMSLLSAVQILAMRRSWSRCSSLAGASARGLAASDALSSRQASLMAPRRTSAFRMSVSVSYAVVIPVQMGEYFAYSNY